MAVAEAIAIEAAKAMIQLVATRPLEELRLAWGFKDHLRKLNSKLNYILAFLNDMGSAKKEMEVQLVNCWLQNIKDVVYFAQDIMDEYAYEILRRKLEINSNASRKRLRLHNVMFKRSNRIKFRFRMTRKVTEILAKFDELENDAKNYGLKAVKLATDARTSTYNDDNMNEYYCMLKQARRNAGVEDGSEFVGRKIDEEKLLQMICSSSPGNNSNSGLCVKAIVGIGGLGKTTLARRLYNNDQIIGHFAKRIWISMSEDFDAKRVLKEMVECPTKKAYLTRTHAIINQLQEEIKSSKFLLVLDDVWNKNDDMWSSLHRLLQRIGNSAQSVILITTRSNEVAMEAEAHTHLLTGLSDEESWALFTQQFRASEALLNVPCFEEVGRTIVEKCKGVPLAIKMIGRSLESKKYLYEWEKIEKSELWHVEYAKNHILPSILLSYHHLPCLSLKQCFAYCAIFRKDCPMERGDLIALWMAQGFLHKHETSLTMEEIGEEFLEILSKNLFLEGKESEKTGRILSYKMHDLVHDLAVYVSRKDLLVWNKEAKPNSDIECRHLVGKFSVQHAFQEIIPAEISTKRLRTINLWAGLPGNLLTVRYLRTLMIDGIGLRVVPASIRKLKLLKYLDLSNNPFKMLPESITKLYQLQTLKLTGCKELTELPNELHKLVNLRHIMTTDHSVFASKGLQQLTCLQTLPDLALRDGEGWTVDELASLHEARDGLSISGLEYVKSEAEARKVELGKKVKLLRLHLVWSGNRVDNNTDTDEEVLTGLEPHPGIIALAIVGYNAEKFPIWMMKMAVKFGAPRSKIVPLSNLKAIKLVDCRRCRFLPTLGQLPFLKYLYLDKLAVECIDDHFYVSDQDLHRQIEKLFPALRELQIWNFDSLTEWMQPSPTLGAITFPFLEILEVMNCPLLEIIPALKFESLKRLRIQEFPGTQSLDIVKYSSSLTSLEVCEILKLKSLPQEVSNHTNLQKLSIWGCQELESLPDRLPASLKTLDIRECPALASLPDDLFRDLLCLCKLNIYRCSGLKNISTSLQECASLKELNIKQCPSIEGPQTDLSKLLGLEELWVNEAGELTTSILQALQHLPSLMELSIGGFKDENVVKTYFANNAPCLTSQSISLTRLILDGYPNIKLVPEQIQLFSNLKVMSIWNFDRLEQLPDWISNLSSLEELSLYKCKNLKFLPSKQAMLSLTEFWHLDVADCPLLTERYAKDGPKWHNISHISYIVFNDNIFQSNE
ncbi:putative disease resistance protein RGA1 [Chenopodium quinoa]|uniref:Uncharacterized protein n=1 Tax=Chenopodium quinoa TaxID=63459 RepID=A0A803MEH3_CHEQI|nr:putative disease resistance protein RGA1 [Chenopodium quinoa]